MKEKIKNWFKEWFSFFVVMGIAFIALSITFACIGEINDSLCYLAIALFCISIVIKNKRIQLLEECLSYEIDLYKKLAIEQKQHFITFLRMRLYQNEADFCKHRKTCTEYISYLQATEEVLEDELKELEDMTKEI